VQLGAVEARPEHAVAVAHQCKTQQRVVEHEVVREMRWHRRAVKMLHPMTQFLQLGGGLQSQLAYLRTGFAEERAGDDGDIQPLRTRVRDVTNGWKLAAGPNLLGHMV